jgi:hypothetical protein
MNRVSDVDGSSLVLGNVEIPLAFACHESVS